MDLQTLEHLSRLSKFKFNETELETFSKQMTGIIEVMDTIKGVNMKYDDTKDNNAVRLADLRDVETVVDFERDRLFIARDEVDGSFAVPKLVE